MADKIIRSPFGADDAKTTQNLGVASAGSVAAESGDKVHHVTEITVDTVLPAITGDTAQALGKAIYTLPAGAIVVQGTSMSIALDAIDGFINTDTPEVGLGNVIAAGAHATIGAAGSTMENILEGVAAADCNGTPTVAAAGTQLGIAPIASHVVYLNFADAFDAVSGGEAACPVVGTVTLVWDFLS